MPGGHTGVRKRHDSKARQRGKWKTCENPWEHGCQSMHEGGHVAPAILPADRDSELLSCLEPVWRRAYRSLRSRLGIGTLRFRAATTGSRVRTHGKFRDISLRHAGGQAGLDRNYARASRLEECRVRKECRSWAYPHQYEKTF